jgi:mannose-6-phosphate isomerase-like protein (cupin superfamily)
MTATTESSLIVIDDVAPKASTCGPIREFWQATDGSCDLANLVVIPKGETTEHWHDRLTEVYLVVRGSGVITLDGQDVPVGAREAVTISPGTRHRLRNVGDEELELYALCHPRFDPADVHHVEALTDRRP